MLKARNNNQLSIKPFLLIGVATLTLLIIILMSFNQGYKVTAKHSSLIDATMEIKLEATYAHLWFEEIMAGDKDEKIESVIMHIKKSVWYANALLDGGTNAEGKFYPLEEKKLRKIIEQVTIKLNKFKLLTEQRYSNFMTSYPGSEIDFQYDKNFRNFILLTDIVESALQERIDTQLEEFKRLHYILAFSILLISLWIAFTAWRNEKERFNNSLLMHNHQEHLQSLSNIDSLTGIANRRAFDQTLKLEIKRAIRDNSRLGLIMIDIDHFKHFNDYYGHQTGDNCLKKIALILKSLCTCPTNFVARYGGEEFAIILPNSTDTKVFAQTLCRAIEEANIKHQASNVSDAVTISMGLVMIEPNEQLLPEELINRADQALYKAKASGRNCVMEF